jgi:hypothetical protein
VVSHDELEDFAARLGGGVPVALRPAAPPDH